MYCFTAFYKTHALGKFFLFHEKKRVPKQENRIKLESKMYYAYI